MKHTPMSSGQASTVSSKEGFTLLITILIMGILLAISSSLMHVTLKQFQLSGIALASETAFHAADAGLECAQYHDLFDTQNNVNDYRPMNAFGMGENDRSITCMGVSGNSSVTQNSATSTDEQRFEFSWGTSGLNMCTKLSVYKYFEAPGADGNSIGPDMRPHVSRNCPEGTTCTVIKSKGYNTSCATISSNPRAVERELILVY